MRKPYFHRFFSEVATTALLVVALFMATSMQAQTCSPTAAFSYTNEEGEAVEDEEAESYSGSAPVKAVFRANPSDLGDYSGRYTWYFIDTANQDTLFTRQMEETDFTFQNSGSFMVYLKATFVLGTDTIQYPEEGEEGTRFSVSIAESHLEMPNAFSPGDEDDINKIYKAKSNHQSIVEFKATIFNRWGQKLYSWTDINGGWDGKVNGRVVKNGVYFVNVVAKGADGRVYHIRKDVNVLTHYTEASDNSGGTEQ